FWFFSVGAPPRCEPRNEASTDQRPGQAPFAPGAGAPTVRGRFWFCCRSTASVRTANEAGTDQRPGQALIRTRGGCSYGSRAVLVLLYDDPYQESKLYVAGPG